MSSSPKVSLIIVSFNTVDVLRDCLASIEQHVKVDHEVILIDNASPDGSADMVAKSFPTVKLICNVENVGFSPANNQGMALAQGHYILLLNPDTRVPPGAVETWLQDHHKHEATLSGPRLVGADQKTQVSAWKRPRVWNAFLELLYLHLLLKPGQYRAAQHSEPREVGFVSGAAMLFERSLFERIGGLDPTMFWMEDADLCTRVHKMNGSVMYLPDPTIVHIGGQSAKKAPNRAISNQLVSRIKFNKKHGNMLSSLVLVKVTYLHVISRIGAFSVLSLFRKDERAGAYRYTFGKLNRYLFNNDLSI